MKQFWEVATSPPINLISPTSSPITSSKSPQMSWKSMPNLAKVKIIFTKKVFFLIFAFRFDEKILIFQFYVPRTWLPKPVLLKIPPRLKILIPRIVRMKILSQYLKWKKLWIVHRKSRSFKKREYYGVFFRKNRAWFASNQRPYINDATNILRFLTPPSPLLNIVF